MKIKTKNHCIICAIMLICVLLNGCQVKTQDKVKIKDLDFTVVSEERVPEELKAILEEKKSGEFKTTFQDGDSLYICVGYGEQESGGYSITVKELYLTDNAIYVDTNLLGPSAEESKRKGASYPYIVLKIQYLDKTVVFE